MRIIGRVGIQEVKPATVERLTWAMSTPPEMYRMGIPEKQGNQAGQA